MARSFKSIPKKNAFGTFNNTFFTSGDYITNKKIKSIFCSPKKYICCNNFSNQSNLLFAINSNQSNYKYINTADLYINLITKLDTKDVVTFNIKDLNSAPGFYYDIDPKGQLFGNTPCGINNFVNYLVYNNDRIPT
jgi:hypothetical protein